MAAAQLAENHRDEWGLVWYFQYIQNSKLNLLPKLISISRITEFKDIL